MLAAMTDHVFYKSECAGIIIVGLIFSGEGSWIR